MYLVSSETSFSWTSRSEEGIIHTVRDRIYGSVTGLTDAFTDVQAGRTELYGHGLTFTDACRGLQV